jgi:hypothetical protein
MIFDAETKLKRRNAGLKASETKGPKSTNVQR